jgi:hypothetical protein
MSSYQPSNSHAAPADTFAPSGTYPIGAGQDSPGSDRAWPRRSIPDRRRSP